VRGPSLGGWTIAPRIAVVVPDRNDPGWRDAAAWCAWLDAWGYPAERLPLGQRVPDGVTTLVASTSVRPEAIGHGRDAPETTTVLLAGRPTVPPSAFGAAVVTFDAGIDAGADWEAAADGAEAALERAAPHGLVGMWRWPAGASAVIVVDGDVDHPTGVDPECSRYVAPALATAKRAGFGAYGIFVAGANVDAEPASFPRDAAGYYNHSYGHPYSHWDARPWEALDEAEMTSEIRRCDDAFRRHLGRDDERMFRLPHFQLEASERSYAVLDELGYRADSSIGANTAVTGGLPFHPARDAWSSDPADGAHARTDPDPRRNRALLQLPISTDPTDRAFPHGCCSYNTLGEGVRSRKAAPEAYEAVLDEVLRRAIDRRALAHLFIDPPDAGYGRLAGDSVDYAAAVERWMRKAAGRDDTLVMTTAELARWWREREAARSRMRWRVDAGSLVIDVDDAPDGAMLEVLHPAASGGGRTLESLRNDAA
jgi:hypothetical protein